MDDLFHILAESIELIIILILAIVLILYNAWKRAWHIISWRRIIIALKEEKDTTQSLEELGYPHSENYAYIASTTPLWVRLRLSKRRGDRKALSWRIKLLQLLNIVGPKTADLLLEEYMITAETPVWEATSKEWTCPKCCTHNQETALFCKNCGEYK